MKGFIFFKYKISGFCNKYILKFIKVHLANDKIFNKILKAYAKKS